MPLSFFVGDKFGVYPDAPMFWGRFSDEGVQDRIVPFLKVGENQIDECDGGRFAGEELDNLVANLEACLASAREEGPYLDFAPHELKRYEDVAKFYKRQAKGPRLELIEEVERLIKLAGLARSQGKGVFFMGV